MKHLKYLIASFALLFIAASCDPVSQDPAEYPQQQKSVLVYMVANNNLSQQAENNINSMKYGYIPEHDNLLVYLHNTKGNPVLLKLHKEGNGKIAQDTVYRFPPQNSADPAALTSAMKVCQTMFPAKEYGLVLWSHGTGWLPQGYYSKTKSFGLDGTNEMDIIDLAAALPYKLDFVLFDACLMGGIEVAYQLKDSVDYVISSPTEILSNGFPYSEIMQHIFRSPIELESVAKEYFDYYNDMSGSSRSATISVVKTSELDNVAAQARELFSKYGSNGNYSNNNIDTLQIQKYYRSGKHWFYDVNGLMEQLAGDDAAEFTKAMQKAVVYKAATPEFLGVTIDKNKFSGLSTYIPSQNADSTLLAYYKKLRWNEDTGYIQLEE